MRETLLEGESCIFGDGVNGYGYHHNFNKLGAVSGDRRGCQRFLTGKKLVESTLTLIHSGRKDDFFSRVIGVARTFSFW